MTVSLSSPVTGASQTGLTSPTYTVVSQNAPDINGSQWVVTALGGTQTGVDVNSVARPFSWTVWWPKILKTLGFPDSNGNYAPNGVNTYKLVTRKGVTPFAGQPSRTMVVTTTIEVPTGAETADSANVRAALSLHGGGLNQASASIGDMAVSGVG